MTPKIRDPNSKIDLKIIVRFLANFVLCLGTISSLYVCSRRRNSHDIQFFYKTLIKENTILTFEEFITSILVEYLRVR